MAPSKCKECCTCCCCWCWEEVIEDEVEDAVEDAVDERKSAFWDNLEESNSDCYKKLLCICCCVCIYRTVKQRKQRQTKVDAMKESENTEEKQVAESDQMPSDVVKNQPQTTQFDEIDDENVEVSSNDQSTEELENDSKRRGQNRRQNRRA